MLSTATAKPISPTDHAQSKALSDKLLELCIDAGEERKAQAKDTETKAETSALNSAINFINKLDIIIQTLSPHFVLNKTQIITANRTLFEIIIENRLDNILDLLLDHIKQQGETVNFILQLHYAAKQCNLHAFQKLYALHPDCDKSATLSSALTLVEDPYKSDQAAIVNFMLDINDNHPFIVTQNIRRFISDAARILVPSIVNRLIKLFPAGNIDGGNIIFDLIQGTEVTPLNSKTVVTIAQTVIQACSFTPTELHDALFAAIQYNYEIDAPFVIGLLKSKGAIVTKETLTEALPTFIYPSDETNKRAKSSHALRALVVAGGELNPDSKKGKNILTKAIECNDPEPLETILNLRFFYPQQLNAALDEIVGNMKYWSGNFSTQCRLIYTLLLHGADLTRDDQVPLISHLFKKKYEVTAHVKFDRYNSYNNDTFFILHDKIQEIEDILPKIILLGASKLSKELLNTTLLMFGYFNYHEKIKVGPKILEALFAVGAKSDLHYSDGETLLVTYVKHNRHTMADVVLKEQQNSNKLQHQQGSFYYTVSETKPPELLIRYRVNGPFSNNNTSTDLFLLANAHAETLAVLMKYQLPVSASTIAIYKQLSDEEQKNKYALAYNTLLKYQQTADYYDTPATTKTNEKEEKELISRPINPGKVELSPEQIQNLTAEELLTVRNQNTLTSALITILDHDINLHSEHKSHEFKHTIKFLLLLKAARFDYIAILTSKTNLPLSHIMATVNPETTSTYVEAACVLLTLAPYLQLKALEKNDNFKKWLNAAPAEFRIFIKDEIEKPRADLLDLVFYTQNRSQNPDSQFDNRVPVFLRAIKNITATPDQAHNILTQEIPNTKVLLISKSQTTRIMEAMQTEFVTPPSLDYTARLRFSYSQDRMKDPAIVHAVEAIQKVYKSRNSS